MKPISIKKFATLYVKSNNENKSDVIERLKNAVQRKKSGETCSNCGEIIWAIGTAVAYQGCFTCITGSTNSEDDYEIDEVI